MPVPPRNTHRSVVRRAWSSVADTSDQVSTRTIDRSSSVRPTSATVDVSATTAGRTSPVWRSFPAITVTRAPIALRLDFVPTNSNRMAFPFGPKFLNKEGASFIFTTRISGAPSPSRSPTATPLDTRCPDSIVPLSLVISRNAPLRRFE